MKFTEVVWRGFPLPPSVNNLYATVGRRRIKSREYESFELSARHWSYENSRGVECLKKFITEDRELNQAIDIQCQFMFLSSRVLTQIGLPKRNDTSNRLKALHDAIGKIVGIDDSWFWNGSFFKIPVENIDQEGVTITFRLCPMWP